MPRSMPFGRKTMSKSGKRKPLPRLLFLVYCALMLWLLFGQRWGQSSGLAAAHLNINLIPFKTITQYISLLSNETYRTHAVINLFGNVLVFIPLGYLLPRIWQSFRSFFRTVLMVTLLVVLVELLQYVTGLGSCDIDDLILNLLGTVFGYLIWKIKNK